MEEGSPGMASSTYRCWVEVSTGQIVANYTAIQALAGPGVDVMPVVKADAYRHGAAVVSLALEAAGARWLAVSNVEEGVGLRLAGVECPVMVMGGFFPCEREALATHRLTPLVHSMAQLRDYDRFAGERGAALPVHLDVDSGMGRLGTSESAEAVAEGIRGLRHARLDGLSTHLASSGDYTSTQTEEQIAKFAAVREALRAAGVEPKWLHLSSTVPVTHARREAWGNLVRPGLAVYGYPGLCQGEAPACEVAVKPALKWKTRVLEVKDLPVGHRVGYNALFCAQRPTRMAVIALGYADGLPHALSNRGRVIVAGEWAPVIGAVSMDLTAIDITGCPPVAPGGEVTVLGSEGGLRQDAEDLARAAGTISYAILCGIGRRVKHVYI